MLPRTLLDRSVRATAILASLVALLAMFGIVTRWDLGKWCWRLKIAIAIGSASPFAAATTTIFAVLAHDPRIIMSRRWGVVAPMGRLGFIVPIVECELGYFLLVVALQLATRVTLVLGRTPRADYPADAPWSLHSRNSRRPNRYGYTTLPLLASATFLAVGLVAPVAAGVSAWRLDPPVAVLVFASLGRALLALVLWLAPLSTNGHKYVLVAADVLSSFACSDVFALVILLACHLRLRPWFAALAVGTLAEATTSTWTAWRAAAEIDAPRTPTFRDWLLFQDAAATPRLLDDATAAPLIIHHRNSRDSSDPPPYHQAALLT